MDSSSGTSGLAPCPALAVITLCHLHLIKNRRILEQPTTIAQTQVYGGTKTPVKDEKPQTLVITHSESSDQ